MSGCAAGNHTHGQRSEGRFRRHRVNCEQVPFLPAWAVAWVLDDPRKIPYLFVWKRPEDSSVREVVRVFAYNEPPREFPVNWTPLLSAVVTIALNTALRKKEIRALRWSLIDFEKRVLTVGKTKTVGGGGRVIPLNPPVFEALVKWAGRLVESKADDYVFPACEVAGIERKNPNMDRIDPSKPITSWRSAWRAALRRAGLRLRFHDLRHTAITNLSESPEVSDQTIMSIAGHLSRKMLEHYSHIRLQAKRRALDAIARPISEPDGAQNWAQLPAPQKTTAAN